jgi:transcription elongation GreA/GreB family factor
MSRAFIKEIDDAPAPAPLERPISSARNLVTPAGARHIEQNVAMLQERIAQTDDEAALPELQREMRYWLSRHATMEIVAPDPETKTVRFGAEVTIKRDGAVKVLRIVGEDESDPTQGLIAWTAPLALALEAAKPGDIIDFEAGGRDQEIEILSVRG